MTVVYVGFDDNHDLGMKGSDSAMPIWADFMKEALALHPEWNGDWQMPSSVRQAEIDTRSGKLIRELTGAEAVSVKDQKEANTKNSNTNTNQPAGLSAEPVEIYVTDVPAQFRRIELFIAGTVPAKTLLPVPEESADIINLPAETPPPPLSETWQEQSRPESPNPSNSDKSQKFRVAKIAVMTCPLSGMRATIICPVKESKIFEEGKEPKDFCGFHTGGRE